MPSALAPFYHDLKEAQYAAYNPSDVEAKYHRVFQKEIETAINYRKRYEPHWDFGARRFMLLTERLDDPRLSNVLIPIIKSIIMARMAAMTEAMPTFDYTPQFDDDDKVELWKDARRYTDYKTNMYYQMQNSLLNMCIFGTGVLWDGYRSAYKTQRLPTGQGDFTETIVRDPKNSKIFTESISPYFHHISPNGQNQLDAPCQGVTVYMDYNSWVSEFARIPRYDGKPLYQHTESVRPGKGWVWNPTDKAFRDFRTSSNKIAVTYSWIPTMDLHMIESNGVMNWLGPNPYKHGEAPFSLITLHPQLDVNGSTQSLYGEGDPHLLSGLDALYQSVTNMFVDQIYFASCSVIGVPQGLNLDIDDQEWYGGTIIKGAENMIVNNMAKIDANAYGFLKILDDLCIWACGVPFKEITGNQDTTAYELSQKIKLANKRMSNVLEFNKNFGLKKHGECRLSNTFQFLTIPEFHTISDPENIKQLVDQKKIAANDVVYEDGVAVMVRSYPMIETKGRVIKEKIVNGLPVPEKARVAETGKSGRLAFRPENVLPTEWLRNNCLPDVMVDTSPMFGSSDEVQSQNTLKASQIAYQRNDMVRQRAPKKQDGSIDESQLVLPFDEDEVNKATVKALGQNAREWLTKQQTSAGFKVGRVDTKALENQMRANINEKRAANAQALSEMKQNGAQQVTGGGSAPSPVAPVSAAPMAPGGGAPAPQPMAGGTAMPTDQKNTDSASAALATSPA